MSDTFHNPLSSRPSRMALLALALAGGMGAATMIAASKDDDTLTWIDAVCGGVTRMFATPFEGAGARPLTTIKPLSCEPLPHVPGKAITTALVYFPPNAYTPAHRHPGSVTAVVLKGRIRSEMQGTPPQEYTTSQTWFEPPQTLHLFAENPSSTEDAEILATFVADENCGPLSIPEPGHG